MPKRKRNKKIKKGRGRPRKKVIKERKHKVKYVPHLLRGVRDILPEDQSYFQYVLKQAEILAESYNFQRIDTPIIEERELFEKGIGQSTDIVEKQMFTFTDKGKTKVCLRPEGTAPIVRAYLEHGMFNLSQPIKVYYSGPMFRRERPQSGRYRQFYQFGLEVIGSDKPVIDAEIISFAYSLFDALKIDVLIKVNSIGCSECRKAYRRKLVSYLRSKRNKLCKDCQRRLKTNPLRILDCKNPDCQRIIKKAPQVVDWLCENCRQHFVRVLEYLDELKIPYSLDPYLVRGLDYYTRTVFEVWPTRKSLETNFALGGGGRYDNLIKMFSNRDIPACGVAFGIDRIVEELKAEKIKIPKKKAPQIFIAQIGEFARQKALRIFETLRREKFRVVENFSKDSLRTQLELADKLKAKYTLIIGQDEAHNETIIVRDMTSGSQETIDQEKIVKEMRKRLR
ncbi:histidine--tRNA ligase [bacterium]|nr:histidine--tRNA ligase [bacterium]